MRDDIVNVTKPSEKTRGKEKLENVSKKKVSPKNDDFVSKNMLGDKVVFFWRQIKYFPYCNLKFGYNKAGVKSTAFQNCTGKKKHTLANKTKPKPSYSGT